MIHISREKALLEAAEPDLQHWQNSTKCSKRQKLLLNCSRTSVWDSKKIGEATANMNAMLDVSAASEKYVQTIKAADESLGKLHESYENTAKIINETGLNYKNIAESLSVIEMGGKSYQQQLETLNKNLSALNAAYELQLKGATEHVKESENIYKGIQNLLKNLSDTADDTKKYREQISKLNENLSALNNVYGNMLAAMNVK